jgi:hypothetical protein
MYGFADIGGYLISVSPDPLFEWIKTIMKEREGLSGRFLNNNFI